MGEEIINMDAGAHGYQHPGAVGYQPPVNQTVVVVQNRPYRRNPCAEYVPVYLRNGYQVLGFRCTATCICVLPMFGAVLTFAGIMFLAIGPDKEFWEEFDMSYGPNTIIGGIILTIGLSLILAYIVLLCAAKCSYQGPPQNNPGTVGQAPGPYQNTNTTGGMAPYGMPPGGQGAPFPQGGQPVLAPYIQGGQPSQYPQGGYLTGQQPTYPPYPGVVPEGNPNPPVGNTYDIPPPYAPEFKT